MSFTAPYNFVPLNEQIYYPQWADMVSMDIPFSDSEDGFIEVEFTNISPLIVCNGKTRDDGNKVKYSSHILMPDGSRRYFIPATSLKGMLRHVMEIMSFGKLTQYQNRWFGYRDVAQKTAKTKQYVELTKQGKPGWLTRANSKYYFQFCDGELEKIELSETTIEAFKTVCSATPDFDKYLKDLDKGKPIPLFYLRSKGVLGFSKMSRIPYKQSLKDVVEKQNKADGRKDLCDIIWGYTDKNAALKGRVQVGHAFMDEIISDDQLLNASGVLGQPNPSYYPLYLKQTSNPYKTYDNANAVSGRKLYKIHNGKSTTSLPQGNDNSNTVSSFRPLPDGQTFRLRINLHNMRRIEIGALLAALTLYHAEGCYHNIGHAKSFGYGKIAIRNITLHHLLFKESEYLKAFEAEMSAFCLENRLGTWCETEQIRQLLGILSEHNDGDVAMMPLGSKKDEGYSFYKADSNFVRQPAEPFKEPQTLLDTMFRFRNKYKSLYVEAEVFEADKKYKEAIEKYGEIEDHLTREGYDSSDVKVKIAELESLKLAEEKLEKDKQEEQVRNEFATKYPTIAHLIDEKYEDGKNAGQYKVNNAKMLNDKIKKWKKEHGGILSDEDKEQIKDTAERINVKTESLKL